MEIYKDIKGYEGLYQVSNTGKVKSMNYDNRAIIKVLKPLKKKGYEYISLYKNKKARHHGIHRLVALHFIDNPEDKATVNHKNGVRDENTVENLEWMTVKENVNHGWKVLGRVMSENAIKRRKVAQYDLNGNFISNYDSILEAAKDNNVSTAGIGQVCRGQKSKMKGYVWKYI